MAIPFLQDSKFILQRWSGPNTGATLMTQRLLGANRQQFIIGLSSNWETKLHSEAMWGIPDIGKLGLW